MRNITILTLLLIFCVTTAFQCDDCNRGILRLDNSRSWFPLNGKTQLAFLSDAGGVTVFPLRFEDSLGSVINDCGNLNYYEYIDATLYLNQASTDSIHFSLGSGSFLCARAWSGNNPEINVCNVFSRAQQGVLAKKITNYTAGSRTYPEAIMVFNNSLQSSNIDSVVIANRVGIVGFTYGNARYVLQ